MTYIPKLGGHEYVVTAYAEPADGPGWSNRPLWIVIRDSATNRVRIEAIQPEDQTAEMRALYAISAHCHATLTHEARAWIAEHGARPKRKIAK